MNRAEKQVVLLTGASSGIGKSAARYFLEAGYTVWASARRTERMADLAEEGARSISMDMTDEQSMKDGVQTIMEEHGRIDILVNNAGYGSFGSLEETPLSEARRQYEVNIFGLAALTQLVLPAMRKQGSGRIINISSIGGRFGEPHGGWYHSSKYALEGLSDSLRMELADFGIDVVLIEPGAIKSEWNAIARKNLEETSGSGPYREQVLRHIRSMEKIDGAGSPPEVIGRVIYKSATARKPKPRYIAGKGGRLVLLIKGLVTDRAFDRLMLKQMG